MAFSPDETNSPLVVDADGMLSLPTASQCFQAVAGRQTKIIEALCIV
jgi:hypothetical protein